MKSVSHPMRCSFVPGKCEKSSVGRQRRQHGNNEPWYACGYKTDLRHAQTNGILCHRAEQCKGQDSGEQRPVWSIPVRNQGEENAEKMLIVICESWRVWDPQEKGAARAQLRGSGAQWAWDFSGFHPSSQHLPQTCAILQIQTRRLLRTKACSRDRQK